MSVKRVLTVHGPLTCHTTCTHCDGEHCWMEEFVERDDPRFAECEFPWKAEDESAPILVCKHCSAWADCPDWWGEEDVEDWAQMAAPPQPKDGGA